MSSLTTALSSSSTIPGARASPRVVVRQPPKGLVEPVRGFGKVWREGTGARVRERLGWATATEKGATGLTSDSSAAKCTGAAQSIKSGCSTEP